MSKRYVNERLLQRSTGSNRNQLRYEAMYIFSNVGLMNGATFFLNMLTDS